jgi:hypothetical protein
MNCVKTSGRLIVIVTAIGGGTVEVVTSVAIGEEFTSCRSEAVGSDCCAISGLTSR